MTQSRGSLRVQIAPAEDEASTSTAVEVEVPAKATATDSHEAVAEAVAFAEKSVLVRPSPVKVMASVAAQVGRVSMPNAAESRIVPSVEENTDTLVDVELESLPMEPEGDGPRASEELHGEELGDVDLLDDAVEAIRPIAVPPRAPSTATPVAAPPAPPPSKSLTLETRAARPWWEEFFNDDYLRTVPNPHPDDISHYCDFVRARLNLAPGTTLLDVGCGLGLHALEMTRQGLRVVGLDYSLPMLSRAADDAQGEGLRMNFIHGDMRDMSFEAPFDAVMCNGTTFGYFSDEDNVRSLQRMRLSLHNGGMLFLDVDNRDFVQRSQPNLVWFEGDGCVVMEETGLDFFTSRLRVKRTVILDEGKQRETTYSIRLYSLHELSRLLQDAGFEVLEVSGRIAHAGVFFGHDSPRLMMVARVRAGESTP